MEGPRARNSADDLARQEQEKAPTVWPGLEKVVDSPHLLLTPSGQGQGVCLRQTNVQPFSESKSGTDEDRRFR